MPERNPNHDPSFFFRIAGVTVAGAATIGAIIFANRGKDVDSEAALQHALRPTMTRTSKDIIGFANRYPSLTETKIGKRVIKVTVDADVTPPEAKAEGGRPDTASLELVTRRRPGSDEPDPNAALSVSIERTGHVNGDPAQNYEEDINIQAPGAGSGDWRAEGTIKVGDTAQFQADTANAKDPAKDALKVVAETPGILDHTEFDLTSADPRS
jgi:hypothetical protein